MHRDFRAALALADVWWVATVLLVVGGVGFALVAVAGRAEQRAGKAVWLGRAYTIAGLESETVRLPRRLRGVATSLRLDPWCAATSGDGTVVLCDGGRLLRLGVDGRVVPWTLRETDGTRVDFSADRLASARDGSLLASLPVSESDIYRITNDGTVQSLGSPGVRRAPPDERLGPAPGYVVEDIAEMPDGSVLVALGFDHRVVRLAADGSATPVAGNGRSGFGGDGGPAVAARIGSPTAVVALPDGGFLVAHGDGDRVRRVGVDGLIRTVAGGGRGWREGARATEVKLGEITGLLATGAGQVLMAGKRGVLQLDPDGTISTVLPRTRNPTSDGLPAARAGVREPVDVLAASDGGLFVLDQGEPDRRLMFVAPPMPARLAVALPPRNRISLRRGRLTVTLTRDAAVAIRVRRGRRLIARRAPRHLPAGRTVVRVRVPRNPLAHRVEVTARAADGAVATHRLAFVASARLAASVVRRVMRDVGAGEGEDVTTVVYRCRRRDRRRFTCDQLEFEYGEVVFKERNATEVTLGADGLVRVGRLGYEPR